MLGVFLFPAFTRLGHECQDLLSPSDGMYVSTTRPRFMLSSERVVREWSRTASPTQTPTELFRPLDIDLMFVCWLATLETDLLRQFDLLPH